MLDFIFSGAVSNIIGFALASYNAGFNFYPTPAQIFIENDAYVHQTVDRVLTSIDGFVSSIINRFKN